MFSCVLTADVEIRHFSAPLFPVAEKTSVAVILCGLLISRPLPSRSGDNLHPIPDSSSPARPPSAADSQNCGHREERETRTEIARGDELIPLPAGRPPRHSSH